MKIEKNIPMPRPTISLWKEFEIGDSAVVDDMLTARSAYQWGRGCNRKFARRKVDGGIRIWRVK